jgi:transposase
MACDGGDINAISLRECPSREYEPAKTIYNRWKRWSGNGIFARIMIGLAAESTDPKTIMIE